MYDIVDKALRPPGKCLLTGDTDGPFIDTGVHSDALAPYVYLHVPLVEYIAREKLGMVSVAKVEELEEELSKFAGMLMEAREVLEANDELLKAAQRLVEAAEKVRTNV